VTEKRRKELVFIVLFLTPTVAFMVGVIFLPLISTLNLSVRQWSLINPELGKPFVGLKNFWEALLSRTLWSSCWKTFLFVGGCIITGFIIGLGLALLLNIKLKLRGLFRGIALMPWVIPPVASALTWVWMFNPQYGIINEFLLRLGLIPEYKSWLGDPSIALFSVIVANIWMAIPFFMVMLLAGLQSIPPHLYEAARVDGVSRMQGFWHITLPSLKPTILVTTLLQTIWQMRNFVTVWIMTEGGPRDATQTLVILVYRTAFAAYRFGYASALGMILLVLSLLIAILYLKIFGSQE
jgi:multiple sugar transport system permease protein